MSVHGDFTAAKLVELEELIDEHVGVVEEAGLTTEQQLAVLKHLAKIKAVAALLVGVRP